MNKIPSEVRSLIRSTINIRNYTDAVSEMIYNSLDADATSIAIRVDITNHKIQIVDNGQGIKVQDMTNIGGRYMTNKCTTFHDFQDNRKTFGFRGEALASIVNISERVVIESLYYKANKTYSKVFYKGIEDGNVSEIKLRPSHGTTITITNFMYNMGVRQRAINPVSELEEIRSSMCKIALLHYYVSFTLRDDTDGKLVLKTHKSSSIQEASGYLFDQTIGNTLTPVNVRNEEYSLEGYIAKKLYINKTFQHVFVNKRYIHSCEIKKYCTDLLCEKYALHLRSNKNDLLHLKSKKSVPNYNRNFDEKRFPVFIINLLCPHNEYEIINTLDKISIQFKNQEKIKKIVKMFVKEYIRKICGHNENNDRSIEDNKKGKKHKNNILTKNIDKVVKDILNKNAEEFGASQMPNAVKGNPAKRKRIMNTIEENFTVEDTNQNLFPKEIVAVTPYQKHKMVTVNRHKIKRKVIGQNFTVADTNQNLFPKEIVGVTPDQKHKMVTVNRYKIKRKVIGQIKKNKDSLQGAITAMPVTKMRETPLILSQIALHAKNMKKRKEENITKRRQSYKSVGINVNILSKRVHHVKAKGKDKNCFSSLYKNEQIFISQSNRNFYKKTTQSSVVQSNYDSHKHFYLANQAEVNMEKLKNTNVSGFSRIFCNPNENKIVDKHENANRMLTENDLNEIFEILKKTFMQRTNSVVTTNNDLRVDKVKPVRKISDMIKTVIPDKDKMDTQMVSKVTRKPRNSIFEEISYFDDIFGRMECENMDICKKQLKDSTTQTFLNLDDIEEMINQCEMIRKDFRKTNENLFNSSPNIRDNWAECFTPKIYSKRIYIDPNLPTTSGEKGSINWLNNENDLSIDNLRNVDITSFTCANNDISVHFRSSEESKNDSIDHNNCNVDPNDFLEIICIDESDPVRDNCGKSIEIINKNNGANEKKNYFNKMRLGKILTDENEINLSKMEEDSIDEIVTTNTRGKEIYLSKMQKDKTNQIVTNEKEINLSKMQKQRNDQLATNKTNGKESNLRKMQRENIDQIVTNEKEMNLGEMQMGRLTNEKNTDLSITQKAKIDIVVKNDTNQKEIDLMQNSNIDRIVTNQKENNLCKMQKSKIEFIVRNDTNQIIIEETPEDEFDKASDADNQYLSNVIANTNKIEVQKDCINSNEILNTCSRKSVENKSKSLSMFKSDDYDLEMGDLSVVDGGELLKDRYVVKDGIEIIELDNHNENSMNRNHNEFEMPVIDNDVIVVSEDNSEEIQEINNEFATEKVLIQNMETNVNFCDPNNLSDKLEDQTSPVNVRDDWEIKTDSLGKVFYLNVRTGMTMYQNPEYDLTHNFRVFKRPYFVPKGLSPILKLGEPNWVFGSRLNDEEAVAKAKLEETEMLTRIKLGDLYYTDKAYEDFASGILDDNLRELMVIKNMAENNMTLHGNVKRFKPDNCFRFRKELLKNVQVINQVDNKFICCVVTDIEEKRKHILLFDQHAVHERIQLEKLIKEFKNDSKWKSSIVLNPLRLNVVVDDVPLLMNYRERFENIGITFDLNATNKNEINITSLPSCFQISDILENDSLLKLVKNVICDELDVMRNTRGNCSRIPSTFMKIISSKACHSAVKFGMKLSKEQCEDLLRELSKCDVPFQCAHGRPALTILLSEDTDKQKHVKKLNIKNLKKKTK